MRKTKWLAAFLIVATLFGGFLGCKQELEIPSDKTAPADVTELTVQAANGNAVLRWTNPADKDFAGVQIAMSPAEGTLKNAVSLGKDVVSFDVSGLTVGKKYTFTVKAFDESLNYSNGAEVKATVADTSDKKAPADVTSLTVTASNGNAVLSWTNPTDKDFAGVQISMSPAAGTLKNAVSLGKDVVSFDVGGLENGKEYTFTVKAFDKSLNYSNGAEEKATVTADTSDKKAPADVTSLTVTESNGNVVLSWNNPADKDFAGVKVTMSPAEGTLKNAVSLGKDVVSFDVSGLENGKEYTFTVKAFDKSLNYSKGKEVKAKVTVTVADPSDKTAPADVTELTATNKDASVLLTWTDATDEDIYGYEVTWNKNAPINRSAAMEANSMMVAPGAKGCYISNLTNGTEYTFTVKTVDTSGNKSTGVTKTITPSIIEKSALQITLEQNTTERTNQDVVITVNPITDAAIKQITYVEGTELKIDTVLAGTDITDIRQITATENTTFTVAVTDTAGRRELAFITVDNIDKTAPAQVTNVMPSYSRNNNAITLFWTNPADEDFAGTEIVYGKTYSEETTTLTSGKYTTSATIENIAGDESEYTIAIKTKDDVGNLSEAKTVTVVAVGTKITSVTIPVAGTNYAGNVLPVTIIGKNLTAPDVTASGFTSTDLSFNNVTIVSDTLATAEITCPSVAGTTDVTVSYGESSATGTLKVVAAEKCFAVGDVLLTDGIRIKAENAQYGLPSDKNAFAVIVSAPYGGGVGKAIGLQKSASSLMWAPANTTGYNTNFTEIQAYYYGIDSPIEGDLDGSDNWEYICSIDPEGTQEAATNYPIFNFANTYGTTAGLTGTPYENGWYVPSIAELCEVYKNKEVIQTSLTKASGFTLESSWYWSSSQDYDYNWVKILDFIYAQPSIVEKDAYGNLIVMQALNGEQFNNYEEEYNTEISSVEIPTIAEGFVGEVPVKITGKDLIQKITVSGLTISRIDYISNAIAIAYATTTGTETETTTITVSCGTASATTTLKVIESVATSSYEVGDIILTDGTKVSVNDVTTYTIEETNKPIGVVAMITENYGVKIPKVIGLQGSANIWWALENTTGYNTEFTNIACTPSEIGSGSALTATFTGDTDGSDNWEYICSIDPEGTQDPATNYPIFNFANTYGTTAGLTGTPYENGWYVPSIAELCEVYKNKEVIQTSLTKASGFTISSGYYWSSSSSGYDENVYQVYFDNGGVYSYEKHYTDCVLVLHALTAE